MPAADKFGALLANTSAALTEAGAFVDKNNRSKQFNHIKGVHAGMDVLSWVAMAPKPAPYIKETIGSAQFYTNRVLKDFKDTDAKQADWAKSYITLLNAVHDYVKASHVTGPSWNAAGKEAPSAVPTSAPAPAAAAPAPAPAPAAAPAKTASAPADIKGGLFSELAKGTDVTTGLKKVDKDQMTHKNPALRAAGVVKAGDLPVPKALSTAATASAKAPPKEPVLALQGKKWAVEYQIGNSNVVVSETDVKQTVYIYKCENSTVHIKGKVNSVTMDSCKKVALVIDSALGTLEFLNSQSIQAQITGTVPTVSIDKTDGIMVYLSPLCLDAQVVTAKSSEMNILVPQDNGDFVEMAVPEQFRTTYDKKTNKLVTTMTDIAS